MKLSNFGLELLKRFEGCKLTAYKAHPSEVWWTIGYGHYSKEIKQGDKITEDEAERLLLEDLRTYEEGVKKYYNNVPLKQNEFDALVIMAYNCGLKAISQTLLTLIKIGDKKEIEEWWGSHYVMCGGVVLNGLVNRRKTEARLFCKGY